MRTGSFLSSSPHGSHRIAFTEWGDPDNDRVLVCVHGLTRNGRDFDFLAAALEQDYRVVCPDVAGRGKSEWLKAKKDYIYPIYCADMAALIAWLHAEQIDWVGSSMGGLIGMLLAAQPNSPIRRLVLNDIGPFIPKATLEHIATYIGADPRFETPAQVAAYLREIHGGFGPINDEQWEHLAHHSSCKTPDGRYALTYDPAIAHSFKSGPMRDVDLWSVWDNIRCPVLVLRGAESDVLRAETAMEMQKRGVGAQVVEFPGAGHAPALMTEDQIDIIRKWLLKE